MYDRYITDIHHKRSIFATFMVASFSNLPWFCCVQHIQYMEAKEWPLCIILSVNLRIETGEAWERGYALGISSNSATVLALLA